MICDILIVVLFLSLLLAGINQLNVNNRYVGRNGIFEQIVSEMIIW